MAADRRPQGLGLLLVPIVVALIAAAIVTVRGCRPGDRDATTRPEPSVSARDTGSH